MKMPLPLTAQEFSQLIQPALPRLRAHALRLTRESASAEDLVQETLCRAWRYRERFIPGSNMAAWLHRILFNGFVTGYRRRKRERQILETLAAERRTDPPNVQATFAIDGGLSDETRGALAQLPDSFRRAVVTVDLEGLSYRAASSQLGCPIGTLMSRLHRGRRALRTMLDDLALDHGYIRAQVA